MLNAVTRILVKDVQREIDRRGQGSATTEAEIGMMWSQARKCWQPQEIGVGIDGILP